MAEANQEKVKNQEYKYFNLISMLQVTSLIATILTINRFIQFGSIMMPMSTLIFPITYFFSDVVAEVYGYKHLRRLIWYSIFCQYVFSVMVVFLNLLPTPEGFVYGEHFDYVLGNTLRMTFANSVASVCGAFVNGYIITKTKVLLLGKKFWLRSIISTSVGEAVVTLIAGILAFGLTLPPSNILHIIIFSYLFKAVYGIIAVIPASKLVKFIKRNEGVDVYDVDTNYAPFSLSVVGSSKQNKLASGMTDTEWESLLKKSRAVS